MNEVPKPPVVVVNGNGNRSTEAIVMAVGQAFVTFAFVGVTVLLFATSREVSPELWTLNVAIVSFYLGQRVPLSKPQAST